ncbi:MAG: NUDIX domain-containing protein [Solirubrobacteraceae bacterium]|nr:NUDIX domain-containing protein [Solirubrobacteraceae bacterium]
MDLTSGLLAHGHWTPEQVQAVWRQEVFQPTAQQAREADEKIEALARRGSPSHDGLAARFVDLAHTNDGGVQLHLQPTRWALRLLEGDGTGALSALCIVRRADGAWLAGRRAEWLSTWAGRWALGAGGAVEVGENPALTLARELEEEWSLVPERLHVRAVVRNPSSMVLVVGVAWIPEGADADLVMDEEHDAHAWWPADPADWPAEADEPLRAMAELLK